MRNSKKTLCTWRAPGVSVRAASFFAATWVALVHRCTLFWSMCRAATWVALRFIAPVFVQHRFSQPRGWLSCTVSWHPCFAATWVALVHRCTLFLVDVPGGPRRSRGFKLPHVSSQGSHGKVRCLPVALLVFRASDRLTLSGSLAFSGHGLRTVHHK